jgi:hypothetical protein
MGKSQRTKGAAGEREVCRILNEVLGVDAHRNLSQTRDGGTDIAVGQFRIECKRRARIGCIYDWMAQSEAACTEPSQIPVVMARADGQGWIAMVRLNDFCRLMGNEL